MEREIDLNEISDGKKYTANDMVKIGCNDCRGCSECCRSVGDTIILDPYDICQLELGLGCDFEELLSERIELKVVEGVILPNLRIRPQGEGCTFLNAQGRCGIHNYRPGFCRMFPMGRIYEEDGFHYFLQVHECSYPDKTKVKLKKWMGIPQLARYEKYILDYHTVLKKMQAAVKEEENPEVTKQLNLFFLKQFFMKSYRREEPEEGAETAEGGKTASGGNAGKPDLAAFYDIFYERLAQAAQILH